MFSGVSGAFSQGAVNGTWMDLVTGMSNVADGVVSIAKKVAPVALCAASWGASYAIAQQVDLVASVIQNVVDPGFGSALVSSVVLGGVPHIGSQAICKMVLADSFFFIGREAWDQGKDDFFAGHFVIAVSHGAAYGGHALGCIGKKISDILPRMCVPPLVVASTVLTQGVIVRLELEREKAYGTGVNEVPVTLLLPALIVLGSTCELNNYVQRNRQGVEQVPHYYTYMA